ncbi:uncharacterized protein LOC126379565 [Pectinophora gossypiella]|uniref:uncharacterized protein LOC126379565 n=1 Tax=Pectinophora gossypiella TaxID=13191 RepID=UPI00214F2850|nr:uncharacterized protein LOC126379565 [Pectinophora gossypiella]
MKCILLAVLAAVALSSVSGTAIPGKGNTLIINVCGSYYSNLGLTINGVLNAVSGLLRNLLALVGIVVNTLLGLLGGLLNVLLGGLLGGGNKVTLNTFLTAPKTKGEYLDYVFRLVISYQAVIDKACPGLGAVWIRAVYISLTITISADYKTYSGSKLFKPLKGNLADWLKQLKYNDCVKDFNAVLKKHGGWINLVGVKRVLFLAVNDILGEISAILSVGVNAIGGLLILANITVKIVIQSVGIIVCLLANLLDEVGDILDDVIDALFGIIGTIGILGEGDIYDCQSEIIYTCSKYSNKDYNDLFD